MDMNFSMLLRTSKSETVKKMYGMLRELNETDGRDFMLEGLERAFDEICEDSKDEKQIESYLKKIDKLGLSIEEIAQASNFMDGEIRFSEFLDDPHKGGNACLSWLGKEPKPKGVKAAQAKSYPASPESRKVTRSEKPTSRVR